MKTYDPEVDAMIQELLASHDMGPDAWTNKKAVSEDVAKRAAQMIFDMYQRLSMYEAEHYNQQIGGY